MSYHFRPRTSTVRPTTYKEPTTLPKSVILAPEPEKLVDWKRPTINSRRPYGHDWLKCVYKAIPRRSPKCAGQWALPVKWYYIDGDYDEPVEALLNMGIKEVFYHLNNIHLSHRQFSQWWTYNLDPPNHELTMHHIIYVPRHDKYIEVLDVIQPAHCYIHHKFEDCVVGSGKEISMLCLYPAENRYKSDDIWYVENNDDIIEFDTIDAARVDHLKRCAKREFDDILEDVISRRLVVGRRSRRAKPVRVRMTESCWDYYLCDVLVANGVLVTATANGGAIWHLSRGQTQQIFNVQSKQDRLWTYYMDKMLFVWMRDQRMVKVTGIWLRQNRNTHRIDGRDLLKTPKRKKRRSRWNK